MDDRRDAVVRFEVLGPLRAWRGDTVLTLGSLQQRVVLAVLLLRANRPIGREQIIDWVWGSTPPAYAVNLLQKHMSGLRRVLEPARSARAPSQLLSWTDAGYLLSVPADCLDLTVFDRAVDRARTARAAGDLPGAAEALRAALQLWRGQVCGGLASPMLDAERDRLAERRISALEERIEVDLALGNDLDLVSELQQLVTDHPLRERLRGLLMEALYRSGRQAEALIAYRDAHRHVVDELGVEPTAQLQRLYQKMLTADPVLIARPATDAGPTPATAPAAGPPLPAQLPHGMSDFTGRETELKQLNALVNGDDGDVAKALMITAIAGTAGVGKTSLAVHWAHQISHRFPDGQLYVNLRGFDPTLPPMEPVEAIRGFLDAFAVPSQRIPVSLDAQAALYRSMLAGRRVLVLLDNARDSDQVRPLLPGSPGCLVVVTSRNRLSGLVAAGAHPLPVGLLSADESRQLLGRRIGWERVAAEPEAIDDIIDSCARLPLALAIVAAHAAVHPQLSLAPFAVELRAARGGLDAFVGESAAVDARAVFSWSYRMLGPQGARLFRLLGLHPGPDLATPAAASLAGVPPRQVRSLLNELVSAHLLEESAPGRFAFHDLLRAYATEQAHAVDTDAERHAAIGRVVDHYLHTAYAADRLAYSYREPLTLGPLAAGVTPVGLTDPGQAMAWFTTEHPVLLAAIDLASGEGFDIQAWQLAWVFTAFLNYQGQWNDWAASQQVALGAARRLADVKLQATTHRVLGLAYMQLCRFDEAHSHARQALDLFRQLGDQVGQAHVHLGLCWVFEPQGRLEEALTEAQHALDLFRAAADRVGEADALSWVGWYEARLGQYENTLIYCQQSLDLHRDFHNQPGPAETWNSLGYAHHHLGHHAEAVACYERALELLRDLGDRYEESQTLIHLGEVHHAAADPESARSSWQQALTILEDLGHPDTERVRAKLDLDEGDPQAGAQRAEPR